MTYVYLLLDPRKPGSWIFRNFRFYFQPFYVGKGVGYRSTRHLCKSSLKQTDNILKNKKILKILKSNKKPIIIKIKENLLDEEAIILETKIIHHFGIIFEKGILTNIQKEHIKTKANAIGKENMHAKPVYQYSLDGKYIKKWDTSCRNVAKTIGVAQSSLARACKAENATCAGFYWTYEYQGLKRQKIIISNQLKKQRYVEQFQNNKLIKKFLSAKEAALAMNKNYANFVKNQLTEQKEYKGYYFKYGSKIIE